MANRELVLKSADLFYVGESECESVRNRAAGLYYRDTRFLNSIGVQLNDETPEVLATAVHSAESATITSANPAMRRDDQEHLLPHTIAIEHRVKLDGSLSLAWVLQNYAGKDVAFDFQLFFSADFRDLFAVRGFPFARHGTLLRPHAHEQEVHLRYQSLDDSLLSTILTFDRQPHLALRRVLPAQADELITLLPGKDEVRIEPAPDDWAGVVASFGVQIGPGERWELRVAVTPQTGESQSRQTVPVLLGATAGHQTAIISDNPFFNRAMQRSQDDLAALITDFPHGALPAAGIPWYVAPFGRDSLITGLQTLHVHPRNAEGTLRVLASLQGKNTDPETEEEPGKILHEMRYGEMARSGEIPHHPYFGTVDATPLFVLLFAETVAWTADETLYGDLLPNVLAALEWIEHSGDTNADGFVDYNADPITGIRIRHRVWKDSIDSLHHVDGRQPFGRVSPVEVQGYVFGAYRSLARVADGFGNTLLANELEAKAGQLRERFELAFWMEDEGFYAQALDGDGSPIRAISSNPGQLLGTGIMNDERARRVIHRLRHPDMDSGWGIRTLSTAALSYNPMSYHNGSIWPHDNSLIAAGCFAIGEHEAGNEIFTAMFDACMLSDHERLNELYCGFGRSGSGADAPVPYPSACSPQAWAAGTLPYLLTGALGLDVDFTNRQLRVDPHLPSFLSAVELRNFTVLGHTGSLNVRRTDAGYAIDADGLPVA